MRVCRRPTNGVVFILIIKRERDVGEERFPFCFFLILQQPVFHFQSDGVSIQRNKRTTTADLSKLPLFVQTEHTRQIMVIESKEYHPL
ncbi:unnamed protein product [Rotaria magnacalcarata]